MNKKPALGKGLSALIPEEESNTNESITQISMNLIKPNSNQPRKKFDDDKILQLSESIKLHGVIQPIILQKTDDTYTIIAGERRWRAAKLIGLKEIPAIIMNLAENDILEISLIENIQREDLNPIEEAFAYKRLIDDFNLTQEELSKRIGKSRTAVTNVLRLLNLDDRVKEYLIDEVISEGHGRALLGVSDNDKQYLIAQKIIDDNLNVRQTELLIKNIDKIVKKSNNSSENQDIYIIDIKDKLEDHFGTKVSILNKKDKGKIEIEFYSNEDLQRILDILEIS